MLRKLKKVAEAPEAPARPNSEAGRAGGGAPPAALRRAGLRCQWERALTDHPQMRVFRTLSERAAREKSHASEDPSLQAAGAEGAGAHSPA